MEKPSNINESLDEKGIERVAKHAITQLSMLEAPEVSRFDTVKAVATIYNTFGSSNELKWLSSEEHPAVDEYRNIGLQLKRLKITMEEVKRSVGIIDNELGVLYRTLDYKKLQTVALPDMVWDNNKLMDEVNELRGKIDDTNVSEKQVASIFAGLEVLGKSKNFISAVSTDTHVSKVYMKIKANRTEINDQLVDFQLYYANLIDAYKNLNTIISSK